MFKKIALAATIMSVVACSKVPSGNVGIKFYLLGTNKGVDTEELKPGRYWIGLNEELYLFPTFTQTREWSNFTFQTVEGMDVTGNVGMTFHIKPEAVSSLFQKYRKGVNEIADVVLKNTVRDALVLASSKKKVEFVYGEGKGELMQQAQATVKEELDAIGIVLEKLYWAGPLVPPQQVRNSINAKIQATQIAQQRQNEVATAKAEADKKIEEARGTAESTLLVAKADADAIRLKAAALEANARLVEWAAIEKWDGKLPIYTGSSVPFVNLQSVK